MDLVSRAKNICLSPASEWRIIESETATPGGLLTGYALPLASIGAIASFIGMAVFASSFGMLASARSMPVALIGAVLGVVILSSLIQALRWLEAGVTVGTTTIAIPNGLQEIALDDLHAIRKVGGSRVAC